MSKLPVSLIIDDAGPVNMFHFHALGQKHDLTVPPAFALHFGKICRNLGVKGKFSVVPCPGGLGRLDLPDRVNGVDPDHIEAFTDIVKEYLNAVRDIVGDGLSSGGADELIFTLVGVASGFDIHGEVV